MMKNQTRITLFALLVIGVAVLTGAYVWQAMARTAPPPSQSGRTAASASPLSPLATKAGDVVAQAETPLGSRLYSIDYTGDEHTGFVRVAALTAPNEAWETSPLRCDRVHFAAGVGICLLTGASELLTTQVTVTFFDAQFQPFFTHHVDGFSSRARIAPDGRYAAYTVFVSGHSYTDDDFSTATHIIEVATGQDLGNLESFTVWRDGRQFQAIDFNFWGVTFANDSNRFYATLQTDGVPYLVEGDIAARSITVLVAGVECPSLSPDNQRIAFKKARGDWEWQISLLDLTTMQERPLADANSVDDQVEWLDDTAILYQQMELDEVQNTWISVMRLPIDGSDGPAVYASRVGSPAVVH